MKGQQRFCFSNRIKSLEGTTQKETRKAAEPKFLTLIKAGSLVLLFALLLSVFTFGIFSDSIPSFFSKENSAKVAEASVSASTSGTTTTFSGFGTYTFYGTNITSDSYWSRSVSDGTWAVANSSSIWTSGYSGASYHCDDGNYSALFYHAFKNGTGAEAQFTTTAYFAQAMYKEGSSNPTYYYTVYNQASAPTSNTTSSNSYELSAKNSTVYRTMSASATYTDLSNNGVFYVGGVVDSSRGWNVSVEKNALIFIRLEVTITEHFGGGTGSSGDPYIIKNLTNLNWLSASVSAGTTYSGKYFRQTTSLSSVGSTSIGTSSYKFQGSYDGNGYTLSGISISNTTQYQALFGYVDGATIKNLTTSGSVGGSANGRGGIVAAVYGTTTIQNCTNNVSVSGNSWIGGIVGDCMGTLTISGCINNGTVTGNGGGVGGINGWVSSGSTSTIQNTVNSATVSNSSTSNGTGGIAGYVNGTANITGTTSNSGNIYTSVSGTGLGGIVGYVVGTCTLTGTSSASPITNSGIIGSASYSVSKVGGVVGYGNSNTSFQYCKNTNTVYGASYIGGIVGHAEGSNITYVNNLSANVVCTGNYAGGVVGLVSGSNTLTGCVNSGAVSGSTYVGGIAGESDGTPFSGSSICQNLSGGDVNGASYVGGVVGYAVSVNSVSGAKNYASVTSTGNNCGGIVGYSSSSTVSGCTNSGAVSGVTNIGGVAGYITASTITGTTENSGSVSATGDNLGGIAGQSISSSSVASCTNSGTVTYTGTSASAGLNAGGIVGYNDSSSITSCLNSNTVTSSEKVGGIVGTHVSGVILRCKNTGTVTMSSYVNGTVASRNLGGIAGYSGATAAGSIVSCLNTGSIGNSNAGYTGGIVGKYTGTAAASGVITKCYSNAGMLTAATSAGGIVGLSTASASYSVVTESWAFFTCGSLYNGANNGLKNIFTVINEVSGTLTSPSDDTGMYFIREADSDCATSVWDLNSSAIETATYGGGADMTELSYSLASESGYENDYYFRLVDINGTLVQSVSITPTVDFDLKTVTSVEGTVSSYDLSAHGTSGSTKLYSVVMSYQPVDFWSNTIYNRAVQTMNTSFNQTNALISNKTLKSVTAYDYHYYNYYIDSACTMMTDPSATGSTETGGAPMNVNRDPNDGTVIPYGVEIGMFLPGTLTYIGFGKTDYTIEPIPLALIEDPDALDAYTYNGRLQAVGAAIIGIDSADALYAALTYMHDSITTAFNTEYDLGLVEAGADMIDYTTTMFADTASTSVGWRSDRLPESDGYLAALPLPIQIKDTGTYIILPRGSIAGNGVSNYEVTEDNGLAGNTTQYTVTLMKKSITLSDFIQHLYTCNSSNDVDYTTGSLVLGKYYDNHLHSSPELFNLAVYNMNNTHMYDDDFYAGSDNYLEFFDIQYTWNQILPNATWSSYSGTSGYSYNLSLEIIITINNIYYEFNEGTDFRRQARDNFNFGYDASGNDYYYLKLILTPSGDHMLSYSADGESWYSPSNLYAMSGYSGGNPTYGTFSNTQVTLWYTDSGSTVYCTPRYLYTEIKDVAYGFNTYDTIQEYFDYAADTGTYDPTLRWGAENNPYWILTSAQMQTLADVVNGANANSVKTVTSANSGYYGINWYLKYGVELVNNYDNWRTEGAAATDITYAGGIFRLKNDIGAVTALTYAGADQKPIGVDSNYYFSGTFDGNSKTVTVANSRNLNYSGIFGYTDYGTVKNLNVTGTVTGTANNYRGAVVGYAKYSNIENCTVSATVSTTSYYVGGIIGYLDGGAIGATVKDCRNLNTDTYAVTGVDYVGGIVGYASGLCTLSGEMTNKGNIKGTDTDGHVGGIIGYTYSTNSTASVLSNAVNTGKIESYCYAGGIIGYMSGKWRVAYCFNEGEILVTYNSTETVGIGGVVGYNCSTVSATGESSAVAYCYSEYIPSVHGLIHSSGFSTAPTAIGGIVGLRTSGTGSPQVYNSWTVYNCTDSQRQTLGHNTGVYEDNGYVYGKFILMAQSDADSYVYGMSYEEWIRVVGNVTTRITDDNDRSASDPYAWGSGSIGLGNLYFKLSASTGDYVRVSVYGGSNFANSSVFMLDVTKGDPNTTDDDATYATPWTDNGNSLVSMYIQSKASAANLIVGFGAITTKDPMFIGETYYNEEDLLQLLTSPVFSESSAYFNMSDGVRRTYITNIAQNDGEDSNTTVWDTGDTVSFTVYVYYYFSQVAATTDYYDGYVYDPENGTHIYNRSTGQYEPSASGDYVFVEDIGTQEGIWVGKATFTLTIQNLVVEFSYTNFLIETAEGINAGIGGDGFSKYYDNYNGFYGTISQPELGDDSRYPYGVKTDEVKAYFDTLSITILDSATGYYPHYAKSTNAWVTADYFTTANHNNSIYGATSAVGDDLYIWFCISITTTELSEYANITFANPYATTSGVTCTSGDQTYIWICTPTAVASIYQRPIVVTPIYKYKNYDGVGYTETYSSGSYGSTVIGDAYDGNGSVYYSSGTMYSVSYPRYARFDGTTGGGVTYASTDGHLPIGNVSGALKGTFTIKETDIGSIVIASGTSRTDLADLVDAGTASVTQLAYLTSTGSGQDATHKDGKEIYIPGLYCYSVNNFATANATNFDVIFDNGYDESTGKWTVGSASGSYNYNTGLYDTTASVPYFEIKGWQYSQYASSATVSGTTSIYAGTSQRAVFATATTSNIVNGSKSGNLVVNSETMENAFHSDRITTLSSYNGENYGYGIGYNFDYNPESGNKLDYYSSLNYGYFSNASGYGWKCTTDTVTFWLDIYFSGDLLLESLKGTMTAAVNVQSYSGYSNDQMLIGIGVIGYSNYPALVYDSNGNLVVQNCTSEATALTGMDSYRNSNGNLSYTDAYACSTFLPAGARGVRIIMRVVADGDMAAVYNSLYITFKKQFTQASNNGGETITITNSNSSRTLTAVDSSSYSATDANIGYSEWNYSAPTSVKYYLSGHGLEFDSDQGNRATMGLNITLANLTSCTNWNSGYSLRLQLYATIGTTGSSDYITIGLKAGHTSSLNGNMSLDNTIYWSGYYRSDATQDSSGDNNYVKNCVISKEMFDTGILADTDNLFTIIFDATANGGMGFSVKTIQILWQWVVPYSVPTTVTSTNTLAIGGGWNLSGNDLGSVPPEDSWNIWQSDETNNEGLWDINNAGYFFYASAKHTTKFSLLNQTNYYSPAGINLGWRKPGIGFQPDTTTYALMAMSYNMSGIATKLTQNLGKSLSDYNLRISYYGEDKAVNSAADKTKVIAYPGLQYGSNTNLNINDNFGVNESVVTRLGYEAADDKEVHTLTISLAVVAEYSNVFTLLFYFDPGTTNLDWYIYNIEFNLIEGGVQKQNKAIVAKASDSDVGSISTGYTTDGSNFTALGYNSVSVINLYTTYGKSGDTKDYLWGSGMYAMNYNATNGEGYAYTSGDSDLENSGYAQMGTSVYLDTTSVDADGNTLLYYANQGRLRVSYEALVYSTGTADVITSGFYKRGMQLSSQFSPMVNQSLIPDNLYMSREQVGTDLKYYNYYFYPYVYFNSGNPAASAENTLTQGTGAYANYWGFSVFFQDLTSNALEMRVKFLSIKIEVIKDFEYDSISYLDDYLDTTVDNTAQSNCDTFVFDSRSVYFTALNAYASDTGSSSSTYNRSYTKAWGFYNLEDQNWWLASAASNGELTHNVLTYSNYGAAFTNSADKDLKIGVGYEAGLGDVITDNISGSIGTIYEAPKESVTMGTNIKLTDRMWRLLEDGKTSGLKVTFSWSGMPNYNYRADLTGTYIETGCNTFFAGWSDKLFNTSVLGCYSDRSASGDIPAVSNTPYSNPKPLTIDTSNCVNSGTGSITETLERIQQTYGSTSGTSYIYCTDLSYTISTSDLLNYIGTSHKLSIFFSAQAYNSQVSIYVWDVSVELVPVQGSVVDTTAATSQLTDDSYAPDSPLGILPAVLESQITNYEEEDVTVYNFDDSTYSTSSNNEGTGIGSGRNNYYYNNKFYYALGRTSVGKYTEYTVEFIDVDSTMWGFEIWLGDYFTYMSDEALKNYTGARFNALHTYDKDGSYVPTYRLNTSISPYLSDWPDQDTGTAGNQWALETTTDVYDAYYSGVLSGNNLTVEVEWKTNEAQYEGDYTAMYASMTIKIVSDAVQPINVLGFNCMGMTSNTPVSLETSRYDGTLPTMQVETVAHTTVDDITFFDLNCNGVYDAGVDSLTLDNVMLNGVTDMYNSSIGANVYKNSWFVPAQNTIIAEFTDEGSLDGEVGNVSSGLGLLMPMRMVMTGTAANECYEWQLDVGTDHGFNGTWQYYDSAQGKWVNIECMSGVYANDWYTDTTLDTTANSSVVDPNDPTAYNIDYVDYTGIRTELSASEIKAQLYLNEIYMLTKYFVTTVRDEVSDSIVSDVTAVRVRYMRSCSENSTFFFAAYDAAGNIATDMSGVNGSYQFYANRGYSGGVYNTNTTILSTANVTGYIRNVDRIFTEAVTVSYYNIDTGSAFSSNVYTSGLKSEATTTYSYTPQNGYMFIGWNLNTSTCATTIGAANTLSSTRVRKLSNALDFDTVYSTYYLGNVPHRQTAADTYRLMPVQKVNSVSLAIYCYMAPIELSVNESGVITTVSPGSGASYNTGDKNYDAQATTVKLNRIGNIATASTDYDGITNPGMAAVGVVDDTKFSTSIVSIAGTGATVVNNSNDDGYYASMTNVYLVNSTPTKRTVSFEIKRISDNVILGTRSYEYTIYPKALTMSFSGTGGAFTYNGGFQGYNLNLSGLVNTSDSVQLKVVSVTGNVYLNGDKTKLLSAGNISYTYFKNTPANTYTFKSVNVNYSGTTVIAYSLTLGLSTTYAGNNNYTLASNVNTTYTINKATVTNLHFADAAVVYSGLTYYLKVYSGAETTSLTKTSPHTGYNYALQYTNAITGSADLVDGNNNTSVVYSGVNTGNSLAGVYSSLGVTVKHPNYNNWSVSGVTLTIVKAKLNLGIVGGKTVTKEYDTTTSVPSAVADTITQGTYYTLSFVNSLASYTGVTGLVIDQAPAVPESALNIAGLAYNSATVGTGKVVSATASLKTAYTPNYELTSSSLAFDGTITKKTITASWSGSTSYEYNGAKQGPTLMITNSLGESLSYLLTVTTGSGVYFAGETTPFSSATKVLAPVTGYLFRAIDYGSYAVSVSLISTTNYIMADSSRTWSITKKTVTLSWKLDGSTASSGSSVAYNGAVHTAAASLSGSVDASGDLYISVSGETSATDVKTTDGGIYAVTAELLGSKASNYTLSGSTAFNWQINPKSITSITWTGIPSGGNITYTYNGSEYGDVYPTSLTPPYITAKFTDISSTSRTLDITFLGTSGAASGNTVFKNAGEYNVKAAAPSSPSGWEPSNYTFTAAAAQSVTMLQKVINSYTWSGTTSVYYTGSSITITSLATNPLKASPVGLISGDVITMTYSGNTYTYATSGISISVTGISNANYLFNASATNISSTWNILKAVLTVSNVSITETYDGNTLYSGTFINGTNYNVSCSTAPTIAISYSSINFSGKNVGTKSVTISGLSATNGNYQVSSSTQTFTNAGTITPKTLSIAFDSSIITKIYNGSEIYGIYDNLAQTNTSDNKFTLAVGAASGRIPTDAYLVDAFKITAVYEENMPVPDGIADGAYDGYVNQRDQYYYKHMVFTLTSTDGSAANYKISVANCSAPSNATSITVDDYRSSESANNTQFQFTITPLTFRGDYTNIIQSYRASGGVANTNWSDVGFTSKTTQFTNDWNAGRVYPVITQAWQQGEDPENYPGIYTKYSIVTGNKINDVTVGPYNSEDLLSFSITGGSADGGKCVYNYTYTFAQPRLVIGYFISDEETGAKVDSIAALMLVDFYYSSGDYTIFTQTADISGNLTLEDYNTLMSSEHPGIEAYLNDQCGDTFTEGSNVEFMPIGIDYDGTFTGEFNGTYNGAGYTINNINIVSLTSTDKEIGLFAVVGKDGIIKNVHVRNATITRHTEPVYDGEGNVTDLANSYVGGIAGRNKGFIYNCSFYGIMDVGIDPSYGDTAYVGGIVGDNMGIIENVVAVGEMRVNSTVCYVGGIAGSHSYNLTDNEYVYVEGVAPGSPTSTRTLNTNKIKNALAFMDIRVTASSLVQAVVGGVIGRAINVTIRTDVDGTNKTFTYTRTAYVTTDSYMYNTVNPTIPDIIYLSNSTLVRSSSEMFVYGDWNTVNRRTGNSSGESVVGKNYNYMRKLGDESVETVYATVATGGYENYTRFVAKCKTASNEPEILDDLYFMLVDIIDVYVIKADQVGTNAAYERYCYADMAQKVYEAYFYDETLGEVYEYNLDKTKTLPIVCKYDSSVYDKLYARIVSGETVSYITLGTLLSTEDPTGLYYITVSDVKYLLPTVALFTKYTTPTGATYTATAGGTVAREFSIYYTSKIPLLANYRFATFTVYINLTADTPYEGGFYGYIKGSSSETKVSVASTLFESFDSATCVDSVTCTISAG